ncbi:MAG: HEAT repeat domain-containing protein [Methanobacterium sp.]|uniref:HEAT repeat domain-containing protein n=1 Tax=Methanobacterium sp. TaxID=2164 RepID=UPI003D64AC00|nr:HEAT repeat domain-containing protein [Methanobacterium sp.]
MGFYDLSKEERKELVLKIEKSIKNYLEANEDKKILNYASDDDFYIRKNTYLILGRIYRENEDLRKYILKVAENLLKNENENVRQTAVYIFGEIGKNDADSSLKHLEIALNDEHHVVKNAVMGALKQMGQKNPEPTLEFAKKFLHNEDPEVRRILVHGIELRGRTHPQDILPLLEEMQDEKNRKVRKMVIHVLSQISYKKGCLETVISSLKKWENKKLVNDALIEIIAVHKRYKFAEKSPKEAEEYIKQKIYS